MNLPIMFLDRNNKTKLVPAYFSLKSVVVITVIISLLYKETD